MPRQRNRHIGIKVTEQEYIRLKERIGVSGLTQTQYAIDALLYGRVVVTGTKENIDYIIRRIEELETKLQTMFHEIQTETVQIADRDVQVLKDKYVGMLQVLLEIVNQANIQIKK